MINCERQKHVRKKNYEKEQKTNKLHTKKLPNLNVSFFYYSLYFVILFLKKTVFFFGGKIKAFLFISVENMREILFCTPISHEIPIFHIYTNHNIHTITFSDSD